MVKKEKQALRVAVLDLYDGIKNEGMRGFNEILTQYKTKNNIELSFDVFDVRRKTEIPGLDYDVYISIFNNFIS